MPFPRESGPEDYGPYLCSREELEASYARCNSLKVPPKLGKPRKILTPAELVPCIKSGALFIDLVSRFIASPGFVGPQRHYIYLRCDPELVALKIFAAPEILVAAEEAGVKPGTVFTEESCGTNALALAREHQRLAAVRGEQHYCKLFKDWWCVASPVRDLAGSVLGYLDISMHAEKELGLAAALLQTLVNLIEKELYLRELKEKLQQTGGRLAPSLAFPPEVERELTPREREVLILRLFDLKRKEIAQRLHLSPLTVKTHCQNAYEKLKISNISELRAKLGW